MSGTGLFIAGVLVTLIVAAAIALIVWGIVLDDRYVKEQAREAAGRPEPGPATPTAR